MVPERTEAYAGVDVSKERLEVCVRRGREAKECEHTFGVSNDPAGTETLLARLLERFSYRVRLWHRVPAMPEVAAGVIRADRPECLFGGLKKRFQDPGLRPPQQGLYLREGLFYGVEVRRVGRQQPQLAAPLFDELSDPATPMHGEVVHKDYLPRLKRRGQDLPHVEPERVGVGGALDAHGRSHPLQADRGDERHVLLPQFLGAFPRALSPLGALPYLGVSAMLVEDSSTNLSRPGSMPLSRSLKESLASSSRSVATTDFF
jgi:hypothetical protein